jgi:anti-sigma factor RsiW
MNEAIQLKLRAYLANELDAPARQALEQELAENPELRQELQSMQLERELAFLELERRMLEKVPEWKANYTPQPETPSPNYRWMYYVGAAILITAVALWRFRPSPIQLPEEPTHPADTSQTTIRDTAAVPPIDTAAVVNPPTLKTRPTPAPGNSRLQAFQQSVRQPEVLASAAATHRGELRNLSGNDWQEALIAGRYEQAWAALEPIVTDPDNAPEYKPLHYYFAALLLLYTEHDSEGLSPSGILEDLDFETLKRYLPELTLTNFTRHRITALFAAKKPDEAKALYQQHRALWEDSE